MRAAFQILAIPYRIIDGTPRYCVFHRADHDKWQFIAGGGEDAETPLEAAKRETLESHNKKPRRFYRSLHSLRNDTRGDRISVCLRSGMTKFVR